MLILNIALEKVRLYKIDEYGVKNYNFLLMILSLLVVMTMLTFGLGYIAFIYETIDPTSPVKNFGDAVWLMIMSASTIGFGHIYPVTLVGRVIVYTMFILGVGTLGTLGAVFANKIFGFADTNIKNRELRQQNANIYEKLLELEAKIDSMKK